MRASPKSLKSMPEDGSNTQPLANESSPSPGYVKNKIKAHKSRKRASEGSRARASQNQKLLAKAAKKLDALLKEFPDAKLHRAFEVLGEQLDATKKFYDMENKRVIDIPDEKTRHDAAIAILAYKLGRPVERSENLHVHATTDDLNELVDLIRSSKGASRRLSGLLPENVAKAQDVVTDKPENDPTKSDQNSDATSGDDLGT